MEFVTVPQAAKRLSVTRQRVLQLIDAGQLKAMKVGRDWLLTEREVDRFERRPVGRPPKKGVQR